MCKIGERIKEIRKKYGVTQKQFAEVLGISQTHVSKIEKNIENPSETLLRFISYKYNVDIDWIKTGNLTKEKTKSYTLDKFRVNMEYYLEKYADDAYIFYFTQMINSLNHILYTPEMYESAESAFLPDCIIKTISDLITKLSIAYLKIEELRITGNMKAVDTYINNILEKLNNTLETSMLKIKNSNDSTYYKQFNIKDILNDKF